MTGLGAVIGQTIADAAALGGEAAHQALQLDAAWQRLAAVTSDMLGSGDIEAAMANSVAYLEAFGHIVVAWIWLQQVIAAHDCTGDFYDGKRQAARYFFRYELPKTAPQLDLLASLDHTTLAMRDSWF
jgi:Acetyl-CoA dehydrogenase C-terminal like